MMFYWYVLLGYEEALWTKKLEIVRFWSFLSYLITTVLCGLMNMYLNFTKKNYIE